MRKTNCRDLRLVLLRGTTSFPYRLFCNNRRVLQRCGGRTSCSSQLVVLLLSCSTAVHCLPPRRPRLSSLPVVRQILRCPATRGYECSRSCGCRVATVAADLLHQCTIYCPLHDALSLSEHLTPNPLPNEPTLTSKQACFMVWRRHLWHATKQ